MKGGLLSRLQASTRARILAAFVVLLGASTVAAAIGQRHLLLNDALDRVDLQLEADAQQLRQLASAAGTTDLRELFTTYLRQNVPSDSDGLYTFIDGRAVRHAVGRDLDLDLARDIAPLIGDDPALATADLANGQRIRYARVTLTRGGRAHGTLIAVADLSRQERRATRVARNSAILLLVVLLAAAAIAFVVAGRVLAPLRRLGDTAAAITESDLTQRLAVVGDDDLAQLAKTFNAMLDRLEAAFAGQRAFVDDVGHELRTPVTIIRAHLDLIGEDPVERQATLDLVSDELRRMSRLVDDLLTLAKAESAEFLELEDLDLDELVAELADKARGLGDRRWVVERADPGLFRGDRQRLTQAVMNLAANAVSHTGHGERIALSGVLDGDEVVLTVIDHGPGVSPEDQAQIFERRNRGSQRRGDGIGLGLAIVKLIAEAHGGRVGVVSKRTQGTRFSMYLPAVEDE